MKQFQKFRLSMVKEPGAIEYSKINSPFDLEEVLGHLRNEPEEVFILICLNAKNQPIAYFEVSRGSLGASLVHPREVFKRAMLAQAHSIIVSHNHPGGSINPSQEDIETTKRLIEAGEILGIPVLDHVIVGESIVSIRELNSYLWSQ